MTVAVQVPYTQHLGNGTSVVFPAGFDVPRPEHLRVTVADVIQTYVTHYSVLGDQVVFVTAPANGALIEIERRTPIRQETAFPNQASVLPAVLMRALDERARVDQELFALIERLQLSGGGGGGSTPFATWTELQAASVIGKAVDPLTMGSGVPVVYRDVICDNRPLNANENDNGGILAMFDGERSFNPLQLRSRLRTQTILGAPTTGYKYTPETSLVRAWLDNRSGHNQSLDSNDGRTGAAAFRINISARSGVTPSVSKADGDTIGLNISALLAAAQKVGALHWLANPAVVGLNGDFLAAVNYGYMNGIEFIYDDGNFDVSVIHDVANFKRGNATGGLGCLWIGSRHQSVGAHPIDAFWSVVGPAKIGADYSTGTFTQAAITLAGDQFIDLNATNADPKKLPDSTVVSGTGVKFDTATGQVQILIDNEVVGAWDDEGAVGGGGARGVATLTANDTVWDITTANLVYITANSSATLVTGIAAGLPNGTEFVVYFNDANTTLDSNIAGGFSLNGFLDVNPPLGAWMRFVKTADNVLEIGRSFGGLVPGFFTFPDGFTTPEVQSGRPHYKVSNTSATTITNFLNGNGSQQITLLATTDNTTIQHNGTTISLIGGQSVVIPAGHMMTLIRDGSLWREVNRTFPRTGWSSLNTGTTPSIVGLGENVVMIHGSPTSITNFLGGANGCLLRLHFTNPNVTLVHSSALKLRGSTNVTPSADQVITLIRDYVGGWIEVGRNF